MKKMGAYKKWAAFVMAAAMSFHIFSGLLLFCPGKLPYMPRSAGINSIAAAIIASDVTEGITAPNAENRNSTPKCCCKKQKKCPVIPRLAIASNPCQRFNGVQREFQSVQCHSAVSHAIEYRWNPGSGPPFTQSASTYIFHAPPLALTCVLLI